MAIYFITSKKHKFDEAKAVVSQLEHKDIDLTEIQSMDPREIAEHKLNEAKTQIDGDVVVDDVSVELEALNGFPGPMAKWMLQKLSIDEIADTVLKTNKHGVLYRCTIGLNYNKKNHIFEGVCEGKIVLPRGNNGFGFDPIHEHPELKLTYAEMDMAQKNLYSHRGIAFRKLKEFLDEQK